VPLQLFLESLDPRWGCPADCEVASTTKCVHYNARSRLSRSNTRTKLLGLGKHANINHPSGAYFVRLFTSVPALP